MQGKSETWVIFNRGYKAATMIVEPAGPKFPPSVREDFVRSIIDRGGATASGDLTQDRV